MLLVNCNTHFAIGWLVCVLIALVLSGIAFNAAMKSFDFEEKEQPNDKIDIVNPKHWHEHI